MAKAMAKAKWGKRGGRRGGKNEVFQGQGIRGEGEGEKGKESKG